MSNRHRVKSNTETNYGNRKHVKSSHKKESILNNKKESIPISIQVKESLPKSGHRKEPLFTSSHRNESSSKPYYWLDNVEPRSDTSVIRNIKSGPDLSVIENIRLNSDMSVIEDRRSKPNISVIEDIKYQGSCGRDGKRKYVDRTVFVDAKYGSTRGIINTPQYPFNTINGAISAIQTQATQQTQWLIKVNPGFYNEIVVLPGFINIEGSGSELTSILAIEINGTSTISYLAIVNNTLPLVKTNLTSDIPANNIITFNNITVVADKIIDFNGNPVISLQGRGFNSNVTFSNSKITAMGDKTAPIADQVLFGGNTDLNVNHVDIIFGVDYKSTASCFAMTSEIFINGGLFTFFVNDGPAQEINLFNMTSGGLRLTNNSSIISVRIIEQQYKADVSYIKIVDFSNVLVANSVAGLDGVSVDFLNLVNNTNEASSVQLLGLSTPNISVPRLKGFTNNVTYNMMSGNGDLVSSGGLYANITNVDTSAGTGGYFIQEKDFTIITDDASVHLFDPALAREQVTDKGKIIFIRNIGSTSIVIDSQNDTIFDGNQTLLAGQSIAFQNNGTLWYQISPFIVESNMNRLTRKLAKPVQTPVQTPVKSKPIQSATITHPIQSVQPVNITNVPNKPFLFKI